MSKPPSEASDKTLQSYQDSVDRKDSETLKEYGRKPLALYLKFLSELSGYVKSGKDAKPYIEDMVNILIQTKRFFDLATIFMFLKNHHEINSETGVLYPSIKEVLNPHINILFIKSITYRSIELDEMFSDILGKDYALLMQLLSHIFKEYSLFNAKLSENIYKKLIEIADSDILSFVENADSKFLAFYLSNIPNLPFVPAEHISKWTKLILYQGTKKRYISKIMAAMKEHPSIDILLLFLLSPRENERSEMLPLLKDCLEMGVVCEELFKAEAFYFLKKSLTSQFYVFNDIPRFQKEIISLFIFISKKQELNQIVISMIRQENLYNDPKITETKIIFAKLIKELSLKDPEIAIIIKQMLKDETVESVVKETLLKFGS
ncbi:MAG: hypothetical protein ACOX2F_05190 [bacterium]